MAQQPPSNVASNLQVGVLCGALGFLVGGTAGILRGQPAILFATASGIQVFALSTLFTGTRSITLRAWTVDPAVPLPAPDLVKASGIAGAVAGGVVGSVAAMLRRRRPNPIPGAIAMGVLGVAGQWVVNARREAGEEVKGPGLWRRLADSRFSPVKVMDDAEYVELLREKLLKVEVEIAVLDDKIDALREEGSRDGDGSG